jgi:hypothetical protein
MACAHPSETRVVSLEEWKRDYLPYFLTSRKRTLEAAAAVISAFELDPARARALATRAEALLDFLGRDAVGAIGEAHFSYILERHLNVLLTRAGWKDDPFSISRGIDLVGVSLDRMVVVYTEVKTAKAHTARRYVMPQLREQLSKDRLDRLFSADGGAGALRTVEAVFLVKLRNDGGSTTRGQRIQTDRYDRIGGLVVGDLRHWTPLSDACPCDLTEKRLCVILGLEVQGLADRIRDVVQAELVANESDVGDAERLS